MMLGATILSKIMECKRNILRKKKNRPKTVVKKELSDPIKQQCRICLSHNGTIPIFGDVNQEDLSEVVNSFGGIEVQIDDKYPKFLCAFCHDLLRNAILFRSTAQNSDLILKQGKLEIAYNDYSSFNSEDGSITDIEEDDKKQIYNSISSFTQFTSIPNFNEELHQDNKNEESQCEKCNKIMPTVEFKTHMKTHTEKISYMCDICGKRFPTKTHFVIHHKTHFYDLPYKCTECPYRGRTLHNLQSHTRKHTGEKPYECKHCQSKFGHISNLKKHLLTHKTERDFKCDTCGKGYHTKKHLDDHFKVDHANIKEHVCNICGKAFGYRKKMMQHTRLVHKRQRLQSGRLPLYLRAEFKQA